MTTTENPWHKEPEVWESQQAPDDAVDERTVFYVGPTFDYEGHTVRAMMELTYYVVMTPDQPTEGDVTWGVMEMTHAGYEPVGDESTCDWHEEVYEYEWASVLCYWSEESAVKEMLRWANADVSVTLQNWRPDLLDK